MGSEHLSKQYDNDLETLRSGVLQMGGLVESQIRGAIDAFAHGNQDLIDQVIANEARVNEYEVRIDDDCSHIIVKRQPAAVMRRRAPQLTEDVVEVADLRLDPIAHRVSAAAGNIDLGPTEFRMLHFFMTHPERVYSRAQLLDEIWGDHVFVEERTVDVHIRRLRQALEPTEHDSLVETVRGTGYRFRRALA